MALHEAELADCVGTQIVAALSRACLLSELADCVGTQIVAALSRACLFRGESRRAVRDYPLQMPT